MRRLAIMVLAASLPVAGFAQDAVIRIEAKRGAEAAAESAAQWGRRFGDVVSFPLARDWYAVALGPMTPERAEEMLSELKASGDIPADSFVTVPNEGVVMTRAGEAIGPAEAPAAEETADETPATESPASETAETETPATEAAEADIEAPVAEATDTPDPEVAAAAEPEPLTGAVIRLQTQQSQAEAETALATWRETFPEAGLWQMPGGWFAVSIGPLETETANAWLAAFKRAELLPRDAFTTDAAEMGELIEEGADLALPAPDTEQTMPSLDEVQRALRWAGFYDGTIDGKDGPRTRSAIAAELAASRSSTDPGTAMAKLIDRRSQWRTEMGLQVLDDETTGLSLMAPLDRLEFDRAERSLSIYKPKNDSGAALILFSQPGGQQELLDLTGLVTALGWVPSPVRTIENGHALLEGANDVHIGRAEGWVRDGRAEGFVLIWPASDAQTQAQLAAEMSDTFARKGPAKNDPASAEPAELVAPEAGQQQDQN